MKLLLATQNFGPAIGGIEQYCGALARGLAEEGAEVTVLAPAHPDAAPHDAAFPCEVIRYAKGPATELGLIAALARAPGRYDAIVCLQWTSALAPALRDAERLAIVCHGKEVMPIAKGAPVRKRAERLARATVLSRARHVIAVSSFTREHAIAAGARAERTHVVHPGVDAKRFARAAGQRAEREELVLLTVARLVERKGIDTVLAALPAIAARHPRVRYQVVGDGPDRARLATLASSLGVADRVEWLGRAQPDELAALYAGADLFVMVSRSLPEQGDVEGFGLVLLEAQAAGTPVIAARSGGMPDALVEGQTGLLVPPSDPEAVASAVNDVLGDGARRAAMGRAAMQHARAQSWQMVTRRYCQILGM